MYGLLTISEHLKSEAVFQIRVFLGYFEVYFNSFYLSSELTVEISKSYDKSDILLCSYCLCKELMYWH